MFASRSALSGDDKFGFRVELLTGVLERLPSEPELLIILEIFEWLVISRALERSNDV